MSSTFDNIMRGVCKQSLQIELTKLSQLDFDSALVQSLTTKEILALEQKIEALPLEYMNILFFRYCFNFTSSDTDVMLKTENSVGKLRYVRKMLSNLMGLTEALIDDNSMRQACEIALLEYTTQDDFDISSAPKYSDGFRRRLKEIKAAQKTTNLVMLIMKRVAIFALICAISFSTALVANAELRERFFNWVVKTFPQFSIFIPQSAEITTEQNNISLADFNIGYVPEGFELFQKTEMRSMVTYEYINPQGNDILIVIATNTRFYSDTEDGQISEVSFKNGIAFYWERNAIAHLIWQQDGVSCKITAALDLEEAFKVAENIKK